MKRTIEQKKQEILNVAIKLFAEKGYEGTTMADIAKQANVGFGTVATYYESKENLLLKCVEEPMESFKKAILNFNPAPTNYDQELTEMTYQHFKIFHEHRLYLLLLIHVTAQWEKYLQPYLIANQAVRELSERLELLIGNGQSDGVIPSGDANNLANTYISTLLGLFLSNTDRFSDQALAMYAMHAKRLFGLQL
jgi:AcrR family transcriptional regulator